MRVRVVIAVIGVFAIVAGACRRSAADARSDLERLRSAHSNRFVYEVPYRDPILRIDPQVEAMFKSRPKWWNVVEWYDDPMTSVHAPIVAVGTLLVDEQLTVRIDNKGLMGQPELQLGTTEILAKTFWVQAFTKFDPEAKLTTYPTLTSEEDEKYRAMRRTPHLDIWGLTTYSTLVEYCIIRFGIAKDLTTTRDGPGTVLESRHLGLTAWMDPDGAARSIRISEQTGDARRYDFTGVAAPDFFPARLPAEVRIVEERGRETRDGSPKVLQVRLYGVPRKLGNDALARLDPWQLPLPIHETTHERMASQEIGVMTRVRTWATNRYLWGAASAAAVFVVLKWWARRRSRAAA